MDFKKKRASIDALNLILNFENDDPSILNFQHFATGSTNLNFGDDVLGTVDARINLGFQLDAQTKYVTAVSEVGQADDLFQTAFLAQITAQYDYVDPHLKNDSHHVDLNFIAKVTGSTDLNFGDVVADTISSSVSFDFSSQIQAIYSATGDNVATLDASYESRIISQVDAVSTQFAYVNSQVSLSFLSNIQANAKALARIDCQLINNITAEIEAKYDQQHAVIDAVVRYRPFLSETTANYDTDYYKAVFVGLNTAFQSTKEATTRMNTPWKSGFHTTKYYDNGLSEAVACSNGTSLRFEKTSTLSRSIQSIYQSGSRLSSFFRSAWQQDVSLQSNAFIAWKGGLNATAESFVQWQEMQRQRKQLTYAYEVAHIFEQRYQFGFAKGLELIVGNAYAWQDGRPVYYKKHDIEAWKPVPEKLYIGSNDLDFQCLCVNVDAHHINFDFGSDDCIPQVAPVNGWQIVNDVSVYREDTKESILIFNGRYNCDRSKWCWTFSLSVPASEIQKTRSTDGNPVILVVAVNGSVHRMFVEDRTQTRQFGKEVYTVTGRSPTALLDAPASPTRTFLQENERTSVQLAQAELDRVGSGVALNWKLIDELGWIVPKYSFSYSNLTPIAAIKLIADSAGGFIYSEPDSNTLTIKPLYKKSYWEPLITSDYERLIPESIAVNISVNDTRYPEYNAVWLTSDKSGDIYKVKKTGTDGANIYATQNNPLYSSTSVMASAGKAILSKAGLVEMHTIQMPISNKIGQCVLGEITAFNGEWWGIVDSVDVSFSYDKVMQTVAIERVVISE
ncbi:hypothetical protein [Acinetobacter rathckeae]|uniref:hypothetical protein n=1 Tax=Acinetobacter rathckeae TaxID=2605272 RepID=UPI0018A2ED32|nr:hypothetical protein [Acinetobacter rathckeae]MBF7696610.1 hypothetical protein [Acinetobacter rathckeae]